MFNSQKINQDPKPYVTYANHYRTDVRSPEWDIQSDGEVEYVRVYEPRPEYDNNPNEILIAFREDTYAKGTVGEAGSVLKYWEPYLGVLRHQGFEVNDLAKEHARKVLIRLVNVFGGAE